LCEGSNVTNIPGASLHAPLTQYVLSCLIIVEDVRYGAARHLDRWKVLLEQLAVDVSAHFSQGGEHLLLPLLHEALTLALPLPLLPSSLLLLLLPRTYTSSL